MGFKITGSLKPTGRIKVPSTLVSPYSSGQFIETDWKTNGDKLATLDTTTGKEWLDTTQTAGDSYNTTIGKLSNELDGWRLPTESEVVDLWTRLFPGWHNVTTSSDYSPGSSRANEIVFMENLFGSITDGSNDRRIHALYERADSTLNWIGMYYSNSSNIYRMHGTGKTTNEGYFYNNSDPNFSTFLISDGGTTLSSKNNPAINVPGN